MLPTELTKLVHEMGAEKHPTRHKAIEQLDQLLTTSKDGVMAFLLDKNSGITWHVVFQAAIDATIKHSVSIQEATEKTHQTLVNKNYLYSITIDRIINYNLEDVNDNNRHFLTKSTIVNAFEKGIKLRSAVKWFGATFLNLLDRGIYSSPIYIAELKVNEFSRILSYLMEVNLGRDEFVRSRVLKLLTRTVELAKERVTLHMDMEAYLPDLKYHMESANNSEREHYVMRLYYLFVSELAVDYHHNLCAHIQDILPVLCTFYSEDCSRSANNSALFRCIAISLRVIYPKISCGDFNTYNIVINKNWPEIIMKIRTIMEVEIRNNTSPRYKASVLYNDIITESFLKMSALVIYISSWHLNQERNLTEDAIRTKIVRYADELETILALIDLNKSTFNEIWFSIFAELLQLNKSIINEVNYQEALVLNNNILHVFGNVQNLKNVRLCLVCLLERDKEFRSKQSITLSYLAEIWQQIGDFIITDTTSTSEIIAEKQIILQALMAYNKLSPKQCATLLQYIKLNEMLKRNECIATIRAVLIHAEYFGISKASNELESIINWAYGSVDKYSAAKLIHNIECIDPKLIADTFAIGIINFLDEKQLIELVASGENLQELGPHNDNVNLQTLIYKYNRKLICLDEGYEQFKNATFHVNGELKKNCLFKTNYELLMRVLNFDTTKDILPKNILKDLSNLHKLSCFVERLLYYKVFDEDTLTQCPLLKRIGIFLSHMEFQLKSTNAHELDVGDLCDIFQQLEALFSIYMSNEILLNYMEKQPLDELITFTSAALDYSGQQNPVDSRNLPKVSALCLRLLGHLCGSSTHGNDAFEQILNCNISWKPEDILTVIKMLCQCKSMPNTALNWVVKKLKLLFATHYMDLEIIDAIIMCMPTIFESAYNNLELLENMLIALNSLLKLGLKKSYPSHITVKIVRCVGLTAQRCAGIFSIINFKVICQSMVKFLTFPLLEVQLGTIWTLTILMNINWVTNYPPNNCANHQQFCIELFEAIEWQKLMLLCSCNDRRQNSIAVTLQTLTAIFIFSSYHQEIALNQLVKFCAVFKLSEAELSYAFTTPVKCRNLTIRELAIPFADALIHEWLRKNYPISSFPYFICYNSKNELLNCNWPGIVTYMLLYSTPNELKRLKITTNKIDVLKQAEATCKAFTLPQTNNCTECELEDYKKHCANLKQNMSFLEIQHCKDAYSTLNITTFHQAFNSLLDEEQMRRLFGFSYRTYESQWYNLTWQSLLKCFHSQIGGSSQTLQIASEIISNQQLPLLELFGALKKNCYVSEFPILKLRYFFFYCMLADFIYDGAIALAATENDSLSIKNFSNFFICDIWFFITNFLFKTTCCLAQKATLGFLNLLLRKPSPENEFKRRLNEISKLLISGIVHIEMEQLRTEAVVTLKTFFDIYKRHINVPALLDVHKNCAWLAPIYKGFIDDSQIMDHESVEHFIDSFIKNCCVGRLQELLQYINKHRRELQNHQKLLHDLVKRLIAIVQSPDTKDSSLAAMRCLAEIGPLKLSHSTYYFQTDLNSFKQYNEKDHNIEPTDEFTNAICDSLQSYLFYVDANIWHSFILVACQVVSSTSGKKALAIYPSLEIFKINLNIPSYLDAYNNIKSIDWLSALQGTEHLAYESWICAFTSNIFEACGWHGFDQLAAKTFIFAESAIQPFVKLLLTNKEEHLNNLITMLDYFFDNFRALHTDKCTENDTDRKIIFREKRAIKTFLSISESIRVVNNWDIPIKLSNAIMASNHCQAYFLSILYLELWGSANSEYTSVEIASDENFQTLAKQAYESIGCTDAVVGFLSPLRSRIDYLDLNNKWQDIILETEFLGMSNILKRNGLLSFANLWQRYNKTPDYEVFWRLGHWDEDVEGSQFAVNLTSNMEDEFKRFHFMALKSICHFEHENCLSAIKNAYESIGNILQGISVENLNTVYKYLSWLSVLQHVEDFCQIQFTNSHSIMDIFQKWETELELKYGNFECQEYILSHQIALFKAKGTRATRRIEQFYKSDPIGTYMLRYIGECKNANKLDLAKKCIAMLREMPHMKKSTQISVQLEDAYVNSQTGNHQIANAILNNIITNSDFKYSPERTTALRVQGVYLMESNAESFTTILNNQFKLSLKLLEDFESRKEILMQHYSDIFKWDTLHEFITDNRKSVYETIAKYADREYQHQNSYLSSLEYQTLRKIINQNREAANTVVQCDNSDKRICAINMKRFANLDEQRLQRIEESCTEELCIAVQNYILYCKLDDSFSSFTIYRIIALWFANKENEKLLNNVKDGLMSLSTYKYISALTQLTACINSNNKDFMGVLVTILVRCARDHPQHTIYQLFPLIYGSSEAGASTSTIERGKMAKIILKKAFNNESTEHLKQFENMFSALIAFSNVESTRNAKKVRLSEKLQLIKNLSHVQCPTVVLPISPNKVYELTSVVEWLPECTLVGGLNAPKKMLCRCSDGRTLPQLLKGKDDLRQDAVMQQVFGLINELINNQPEFLERKLYLRTYKVTPLSMRCGILEWCENTIPVGHYLIGPDSNGGAHRKYRPQDWTISQCRKLSVSHHKSSYEERLEAYKNICDNFKPVFNYFLLEKFHIPGEWFEKRLSYINSVATTSIVGFILGLGDRHVQNILIDEKTAEVVHIDFGIAFEQGKVLATPEPVPFRLTRDLVAPMGVCGTNGVFTKSCEATLHILRGYKSVILTVLEVLLHDPLYLWGVLSATSEDNTQSLNLCAQRALLVVQSKLEGKEAGLLDNLNVEVQVQRLINEATLPNNLCMLFPGWYPYL